MPFMRNDTFNPNENETYGLKRGRPETLAVACDAALKSLNRRDVIATSDGQALYCDGRRTNINMSDIYTGLIHVAGRFAERYASDLVYTIESVQDLISRIPDEADFGGADKLEYYVAAGVRENGVDGNEFVISRLNDTAMSSPGFYANPHREYRKLLCVKITFTRENVRAELLDVTNHVLHVADEDMSEELRGRMRAGGAHA